MLNHKIKYFCLTLILPMLVACTQKVPQNNANVMAASISTDGNYVITTNAHFDAILWNLKVKTYKILSTKANRYSAYFIKNTNDFLYQDATTKEVYVIDTNGNVITHFNPGFSSYGQAMTSDLSTYIAVDQNDQVFTIENNKKTQLLWHWCGPSYQDETPAPTGKPYSCGSFIGDGKLFNISLSNDNSYFTTSGFSEIYIWNLPERKLVSHITLSDAQSLALIDPNNRYIIYGDLKAQLFKCNLSTNTCQHFFVIPEQLPNEPENYQNMADGIQSIKFITKNDYLIFYQGIPDIFPFAALYSLDAKTTLIQRPGYSFYTMTPKYLSLLGDNKIFPALQDFVRDQAIDTSPSAHILVMAQQNGNGILVYQYDPKSQTLKQVWAPTIQ